VVQKVYCTYTRGFRTLITTVADRKLLISYPDPDLDPTWQVITDPDADPTRAVISDPYPAPGPSVQVVLLVSDPDPYLRNVCEIVVFKVCTGT